MIIDVSEHNGRLNWTTLKPQIEGAIIRCGYGRDIPGQDDKQWDRNVAECERLGIKYGVYLYSYAKDTDAAKSEAEHVARLLRGHKPDLPIFYDIEEPGIFAAARKNYHTFETALKRSYRIGLYSGEAYYNSYLQGVTADYLWIARYGADNGKIPEKKPSLSDGRKIHLWQYTSRGLGGHMDCSEVLDLGIFSAQPMKASTRTKIEPAKYFSSTVAGTYIVATKSDPLMLRYGPGTNRKIITRIPKGDKVQCFGYYSYDSTGKARWLYCAYKEHRGYLCRTYLRLV